MRRPQENPVCCTPPLGGPCHRVWRALLCALAASVIAAVGLGLMSGGALGADGIASTPTSPKASPPATPSNPGAGAQDAGAGVGEAGTGKPSASAPVRASTGPQATAPASARSDGPTVVLERRQQTTPASNVSSSPGATKKSNSGARSVRRDVAAKRVKSRSGATNKSKGGASSAPNGVALPPQVVAAQAGALAAQLANSAASAQALAYYRIPLFLLPIYHAAAARYGVPWQILAAINEIETDYGSNLSVSTAGAVGWMQFMPATWVQYGVDARSAGYADPYNPIDAIFAAARYLRAAGAQSNLRQAILAYNHSDEYVASVLLRAKLISTYPKPLIGTLTGLVDAGLPLTGRHVAWGAAVPVSSSRAGVHPNVPSSKTAPTRSASVTPGSTGPLPPAAAAAAATGAHRGAAQTLRLVDLMSARNAAVVAVQDGRIMQIGRSRELGSYVVLRDIYGDAFTYAGVGNVARTYSPPKVPRTAVRAPAAAGAQLPLTVIVKTPDRAANAARARGSGVSARPGSSASKLAGHGKVRLFAHPGNPDALGAQERTAAGPERAPGRASHVLPLRVGTLVVKGTVLGHVRVPTGAKDGHLRFGIRPAGDANTIDPAPILANWVLLNAALHPRGARRESILLGATASDAFRLSESQLRRDILSDPGIAMPRCFRAAIASRAIDMHVLAPLAFLSRSGLKPTLRGPGCGRGAYHASGYTDRAHRVVISQINRVPIADHQGAGSITDTTIRTLLTLRGEFVPRRIVSLMHYPGATSTLARADHADYIEIDFSPLAKHGLALLNGGARKSAHSASTGRIAPPPMVEGGEVTASQWDRLIARIAAWSAPTILTKPSSAAIRDHMDLSGIPRTVALP
jgi:soluble lytic murein transglycosylase-like protein